MFANELNSAKRPILENKFVVLLRLWSSRFVELRFNQERIVLVLTLALFISFCLTLNQFATAGNLISLLQSVAILGVLGVGMAFVIIGRGIDLAMVTVMAISVAWMFNEINRGLSIAAAFGLGIGLAALVGVANGVLVAYFEDSCNFHDACHGDSSLWLAAGSYSSTPMPCSSATSSTPLRRSVPATCGEYRRP